jgi:hypothetical protein
MHTVQALEEALQAAERLGYQVRREWLDGGGGGACEFGGKQWMFVDLSQSAAEQLEQVLSVLRSHATTNRLHLSPLVGRLCRTRKTV